MTPAALRDLFRHMRWADAEVWHGVLRMGDAANDEPLRSLLLHLHTVQQVFLDVWKQRPLATPEVSIFAHATDIHAWSLPYYAEAEAFIESLDERALMQAVTMPWAAAMARHLGVPPATPTLGETIFQVTSHSTYHRGQVNARLRAIGGEPPLVDYIAWIWFGRPVAGSPLRT
jgi:uncharacterized damage-inducible protein DinB